MTKRIRAKREDYTFEENERVKDIPGSKGYAVTDSGKFLRRYPKDPDKFYRIMPKAYSKGLICHVYFENGKDYSILLAKLVLVLFSNDSKDKTEEELLKMYTNNVHVDYKDEIIEHCNLDNLVWGAPKSRRGEINNEK